MAAAQRTSKLRSHWLDLLLLVVLKACVSSFVLSSGFVAISDDDFSRIVIAQSFAEAPSADPSGTSWLPFPFWLYGSALALLGNDLGVVRAVAIGLGLASTAVLWLAARVLGASRAGALLGAAVASVLPYSAWLGVAAVPEVPTAALSVLAAATLARAEPRLRLLGALALGIACLSRYEPWPIAVVFASITAVQARRQRSGALSAAAVLALAAPLLWLVHGVATHGDALFFVQRVTAYRKALGGDQPELAARLLWYPIAFVRSEPELVALSIVAFVTARVTKRSLERFVPVLWCLLALLAFLVFGSVRGGTPTHHAERTLLACWFGLALFCGDVLSRFWSEHGKRARLILLGAVMLETLGAVLLRPYVTGREPFITRRTELGIGREARLLGAESLVVATDDYGYFAVIAAFGSPARAAPLHDRDPRKSRAPDLLAQPQVLAGALRDANSRWLVAPRRYEASLKTIATLAARNEGFVLMEAKR